LWICWRRRTRQKWSRYHNYCDDFFIAAAVWEYGHDHISGTLPWEPEWSKTEYQQMNRATDSRQDQRSSATTTRHHSYQTDFSERCLLQGWELPKWLLN
jgi:hypothetical protein